MKIWRLHLDCLLFLLKYMAVLTVIVVFIGLDGAPLWATTLTCFSVIYFLLYRLLKSYLSKAQELGIFAAHSVIQQYENEHEDLCDTLETEYKEIR